MINYARSYRDLSGTFLCYSIIKMFHIANMISILAFQVKFLYVMIKCDDVLSPFLLHLSHTLLYLSRILLYLSQYKYWWQLERDEKTAP